VIAATSSSAGTWATFGPDVLVAGIGAALTVTIALISYRMQQRRMNRQLVRNLADDLAIRRAFQPIYPCVSSPDSDDAERCRISIQEAQGQISRIRDQIAPDHELRGLLQEMVLWCREYKNLLEADDSRWQFALMEVRKELVDRLREIERSLRLKAPALPDPGTAKVSRTRS
jgi:hypothetical protein